MEHGESSYRRFLNGDEEAFSEILKEYRSRVTFFIQRYVHDAETAEDLAIDVFMQLVVHPHRYNFKYALSTYLFMLARSRALDWLRKSKRHETVSLEDVQETLADAQSVEEDVLRGERSRQLHAAIAQLPEDQQVAVHLVYFEDRSYADTAKIMRKSAKQVDNLLFRAKKALREILGEEGALA